MFAAYRNPNDCTVPEEEDNVDIGD